MQYTAKHRYADVGPRKIRLFADLIRGKNVDEALQLLRFYHNRGCKAAHGRCSERVRQRRPSRKTRTRTGSIVSECRVDGAPMFKRIQPRARGTAFQIKRRMSHIIVTLADPEDFAAQAVAPREDAAAAAAARREAPAVPRDAERRDATETHRLGDRPLAGPRVV